MLLSSGHSLIKSVESIFRPYYFAKLFGSRKSNLQNHIVFFCCFFFAVVCFAVVDFFFNRREIWSAALK